MKYSIKKMATTSKERHHIAEDLFTFLTEVLNDIHQINYSKRFWKILIAPYVKVILNNFDTLTENKFFIEPSNFTHGNLFKSAEKHNFFSMLKTVNNNFFLSYKWNKIKNELKNNNDIVSSFHYPKSLKAIYDTYIDVPELDIKKSCETYLSLRNVTAEKFIWNNNHNFSYNVIHGLPKIYVEYFNLTLEKIPLYNPKEKVFHISMIQTMLMRFVLAKYIENGAILKYYQHGGFYGEYQYHNAYLYENSVADEFMTWGWRMNKKDTPSRAFRLEKFKSYFKYDSLKKYDILLVYPFIHRVNKDRFYNFSSIFFNNLNRNKYKKICARPRPVSSFNRKGNLKFLSQSVDKIDAGFINLSKLVSKSRLVVLLNYPSTTMLECLYVNQPVIGVLNNETPSNVVKPYYDFLLNVGILHNSMESLVNHLNEKDIPSWWAETIKEKMYKEFKNKFLRTV